MFECEQACMDPVTQHCDNATSLGLEASAYARDSTGQKHATNQPPMRKRPDSWQKATLVVSQGVTLPTAVKRKTLDGSSLTACDYLGHHRTASLASMNDRKRKSCNLQDESATHRSNASHGTELNIDGPRQKVLRTEPQRSTAPEGVSTSQNFAIGTSWGGNHAATLETLEPSSSPTAEMMFTDKRLPAIPSSRSSLELGASWPNRDTETLPHYFSSNPAMNLDSEVVLSSSLLQHQIGQIRRPRDSVLESTTDDLVVQSDIFLTEAATESLAQPVFEAQAERARGRTDASSMPSAHGHLETPGVQQEFNVLDSTTDTLAKRRDELHTDNGAKSVGSLGYGEQPKRPISPDHSPKKLVLSDDTQVSSLGPTAPQVTQNRHNETLEFEPRPGASPNARGIKAFIVNGYESWKQRLSGRSRVEPCDEEKDGSWNCHTCGSKHHSWQSLERHAAPRKHRAFACQKSGCNASASTYEAYKRHLQTHDADKKHFCPCQGCKRHEKGFNRRDLLNSHIQNMHPQAWEDRKNAYPKVCEEPGCKFATHRLPLESEKEYMLHMSSCHGKGKPYECFKDGCKKNGRHGYSLESRYKSHLAQHHASL